MDKLSLISGALFLAADIFAVAALAMPDWIVTEVGGDTRLGLMQVLSLTIKLKLTSRRLTFTITVNYLIIARTSTNLFSRHASHCIAHQQVYYFGKPNSKLISQCSSNFCRLASRCTGGHQLASRQPSAPHGWSAPFQFYIHNFQVLLTFRTQAYLLFADNTDLRFLWVHLCHNYNSSANSNPVGPYSHSICKMGWFCCRYKSCRHSLLMF